MKEHEAGASVPQLARRHGVSENTIFRWKSKFGGMEISEAKLLRKLEQENARLKRLLAEAELDKAALKELGIRAMATRPSTTSSAARAWSSIGHYNEVRPHPSLRKKPPAVFAREAA